MIVGIPIPSRSKRIGELLDVIPASWLICLQVLRGLVGWASGVTLGRFCLAGRYRRSSHRAARDTGYDPRMARAAIFRSEAIYRRIEDWQGTPQYGAASEDRFTVPAGITCLVGEVFPVILVSARPHHRIDARTAAEHLPYREQQPAAVEQWIGHGLKSPIPFCSEIGEPMSCLSYAWHVVGPLEQQHGG